MEWMILPLKRYFDFSGRSRRKEYWMFFLLTIIVGIVAGIIDSMLGFGTASSVTTDSGVSASFSSRGPVAAITSLALLIPSIAVAIRRLHDTDRSGWWLLLVLIPIIGWIVLLVFYCTDGTRGTNRFGPDPKDPGGSANAAEVFS